PGRTPISVPISAPASAKKRLAGVSATPNPTARLCKSSIYHSGQTGMVNPSPRMKMPQERTISTRAAASVSSGRNPPAAPAPRDRAHAHQQQNRNHEPKPLDAEPEDHQACGDENDRSQCRDVARRQRPRILGFAQSLHQNDDAKAEQEPAQQPRHVAGTHAQ